MTTTAIALVIVAAMTQFGAGLVTILTAVVGLFVAIYLFRRGVKWVKHSGK